MKLYKDFILSHNIWSKPAKWYNWLTMHHQCWEAGFDFPSSHTEDL